MMYRKFLPLLSYVAVAIGCTSVGMHDTAVLQGVDFGPRQPLRFCLLRDTGVAASQTEQVMTAIATELDRYGLDVQVAWTREWHPVSSNSPQLMNELVSHPIEPPCDRLLALVARPPGEQLWGVLTEGFGSVETNTSTHGYVFVPVPADGNLGRDPAAVAVHETYHLLGCRHDSTLAPCYHRIAEMKAAARTGAATGEEFFPGYSLAGEGLPARAAVNALMEQALREDNGVNVMVSGERDSD